jgi:hypothetical protein
MYVQSEQVAISIRPSEEQHITLSPSLNKTSNIALSAIKIPTQTHGKWDFWDFAYISLVFPVFPVQTVLEPKRWAAKYKI